MKKYYKTTTVEVEAVFYNAETTEKFQELANLVGSRNIWVNRENKINVMLGEDDPFGGGSYNHIHEVSVGEVIFIENENFIKALPQAEFEEIYKSQEEGN